MSETKTLKIFEPFKTYFEILCQSGKCEDFSSDKCKELITLLTTTYESRKGECLPNYVNSLRWFAYELKKADSPISLYTIKGKLKDIFLTTTIEDIVNKINKNTEDLNGFKMNQDTGEDTTYEAVLNGLINTKKYDTKEKLFEAWINEAFSSYSENKMYFEDEIKPYLETLDNCQKRILNDYFEIKIKDETSNVSVNDYISRMKTDFKGKEARLNSKVDGDRAKIVNLLPESVKDAFNEYLVTPPNVKPEFIYKNSCYEFKPTTEEPDKEAYKVPDSNIEKILEWFGNIAKEMNSRPNYKEDEDKPDTTPYEQDGVKFMFPDDFEVVKYDNKWGLDRNGKLYKRDGDEFKLYPEDKLEADAKSFKEKDGKTTCGNLCIFDKPEECNKFFEKLIKGDELSMKELSETINNGNFVSSYEALKTNISEVNPLFVVGTLKLFGFQKYTQIDADGKKIVKIENFTNWWNRQNQKKDFDIKANSYGSHKTTEPEAPANVELFFKLLINFINLNEFVLNPRDKRLMTKSGKKPMIAYPPQPEHITWTDASGNKHTYKNVLYKNDKASKDTMSIAEIAFLMKKNASFTGSPIGSKMSDNVLNLSTLLGLMTQMTTGGKFSFLGKAHSPLSGMGYLVGGSPYLPCTRKAFEIYEEGKSSLKKNNKTFDTDKELFTKIEQLGKLESDIAVDLEKLASIVKIINVLGDKKEEALNSAYINDLIEKYGKGAEKCAKKSDSIIVSILEKIGKSSYYSKIY
jgi:hypothetical protein